MPASEDKDTGKLRTAMEDEAPARRSPHSRAQLDLPPAAGPHLSLQRASPKADPAKPQATTILRKSLRCCAMFPRARSRELHAVFAPRANMECGSRMLRRSRVRAPLFSARPGRSPFRFQKGKASPWYI